MAEKNSNLAEGIRISETRKAGQPPHLEILGQIRYLWQKRKWLLKVAAVGAVAGVIVALGNPKEYTTTVKLAPETEDMARKMSGLGGLAAMAGINLNSATSSDAISPDLYPDVVQSTPFMLELFAVPVAGESFSGELYEYMTGHGNGGWLGALIALPSKAADGIKGLFSRQEPAATRPVDPFHLTDKQVKVVRELRKRIEVAVNKKTLVLTLSVRMQDPVISARLTDIVLEKLQEYITAYRTRKAKNDLEFTRQVFGEAREAYYKAQQAYATFEDANRNIISSSYRTEQERLKNEMTLTFNVYNTLAQKLEQDKLRVQERTPVYTILEPATVPLKPSTPRKIVVIAAFIVLALLLGIGYLYARSVLTGHLPAGAAAQPVEREGE